MSEETPRPFDMEGFIARHGLSMTYKFKSERPYYTDGQITYNQRIYRITAKRPSGKGYDHTLRTDWTLRDTQELNDHEPTLAMVLEGMAKRAITMEQQQHIAARPNAQSKKGDQELTVNFRFAETVRELRNFLGDAAYKELLGGLYGETTFAYSAKYMK